MCFGVLAGESIVALFFNCLSDRFISAFKKRYRMNQNFQTQNGIIVQPLSSPELTDAPEEPLHSPFYESNPTASSEFEFVDPAIPAERFEDATPLPTDSQLSDWITPTNSIHSVSTINPTHLQLAALPTALFFKKDTTHSDKQITSMHASNAEAEDAVDTEVAPSTVTHRLVQQNDYQESMIWKHKQSNLFDLVIPSRGSIQRSSPNANMNRYGSSTTTNHTISGGLWDGKVIRENSLLPIRFPKTVESTRHDESAYALNWLKASLGALGRWLSVVLTVDTATAERNDHGTAVDSKLRMDGTNCLSIVFQVNDAGAKLNSDFLFVYGSCEQMGNWKIENAIQLHTTYHTYPCWVSPPIPLEKKLKSVCYGFFRRDNITNESKFELLGNRILKLNFADNVILSHTFGVPGVQVRSITLDDEDSTAFPAYLFVERIETTDVDTDEYYNAIDSIFEDSRGDASVRTPQESTLCRFFLTLGKGLLCFRSSDYLWQYLADDLKAASFVILN